MTETPTPSRRSVLAATGGAFVGGLVVDRVASRGADRAASTREGPATSRRDGRATSRSDDRVEVNVGYTDDSAAAAARATATDVVREIDGIDVVTVVVPGQAADALAGRPDVDFVEPNGRMYVQGQTLPWGVDRVDADVATANGVTGAGADVAILDTGVDDDHPDAELGVGTSRAFATCGASDTCNCATFGNSNACNFPWSDDNDHGTHVAGTVGAADDGDGVVGVAPGVTLHAVKVIECDGGGSVADIAAGLEWTADQGYDVATMSFAGSFSKTLDRSVDYAASRGVTMVAAAGNFGPCTDCVGYPARAPEVVAVGATDCNGALATSSSTGPEVDLVAPGVDVYSTVPSGYFTAPGARGWFTTSMACAHVGGAAGALAAQGQSRAQIRSTLTGTAEDLGLSSNEQGAGLLDVASAAGLPSTDDGLGNGPNC